MNVYRFGVYISSYLFLLISSNILTAHAASWDVDRSFVLNLKNIKNPGNRGHEEECCNSSVEGVCQPCPYELKIMFLSVDDYVFHIYSVKLNVYEPGEENKGAYFSSLLPIDKNEFDISCVIKGTDKVFEVWSFQIFNNYESFIDELYGSQQLMKITGYTKIRQLVPNPETSYRKMHLLIFQISSIYWINYVDTRGECCAIRERESCNNSCPYNVRFFGGDHKIIQNEAPLNRLDTQIIINTFNSRNYQRDKINVTVLIKTEDNTDFELFDIFELVGLKHVPNQMYSIKNHYGMFGNLKANFTLFHQCGNNYYINCKLDCEPELGGEYCDLDGYSFDGNCTNGATDAKTCNDVQLKCHSNSCKNGGKCQDFTGKATCLCLPGYTGQFCESFTCDDSCNGRGICIASNSCSCWDPNFGLQCESTACDEPRSRMCKHDSICVIQLGRDSCQCSIHLIGKFCEEPFCNASCNLGRCAYDITEKRSLCLCQLGYRGRFCEITDMYNIQHVNSVKKKNMILILTEVFVLLFLFLLSMGMAIYLKNNKFIPQRHTLPTLILCALQETNYVK